MKFCALNMRKYTDIKTDSDTAMLLIFHKKTVFFLYLEQDTFYQHKRRELCNGVSIYLLSTPQSCDRVEFGGLAGGDDAEEEAYCTGYADSKGDRHG